MSKQMLIIELNIDYNVYNKDDMAQVAWFLEDVMSSPCLTLHSSEIDDTVGSVAVIRWLSNTDD